MKFNVNSFNKYLSAQAMGDFNRFLEELPLRTGYGVLIAGGVAWLLAGLAIVYATTVAREVADIRSDLVKSEALKPVVPKLTEIPVPEAELEKFVQRVNPLYKDVNITSSKNVISFQANSGRFFGAYREAINHAYNGGQGWRLSLQSICVGRECSKKGFLSGEFKVSRLKVER